MTNQKDKGVTRSDIVVSAAIAYLAVWEYPSREFINGIEFPMGLSPDPNRALAILTILPVFVAIAGSILNRRTRA